MKSEDKADRRDFLKGAVAVSALAGLGGQAEGQQRGAIAGQTGKFNGIQMGPHTILDEGIDRCLDLIQDTAGINALMVYSHTYHGDIRKPPQLLAADHGVSPREMRNRKLPWVWVKHHEQYFKGTILRHQKVDNSFEYANRDLLAELVEPCRKRGMKLYARILEGSGREVARIVEGYSKVETVDIYGRPTPVACWNHPDYRAWWNATVEDLFRTYPLDGLQWGAERQGPLMNVIMPWNDGAPVCFCQHCRARGRAQGIDVERARQGFEDLYVYVRAIMAGKLKPADGVFTGFLRVLLRYPEVLAWEYQYRLSREEVLQGMYGTVKGIRPDAQVGWHVDHQPSSWDLVYRAELSYEEMAPYSDFIKFIAYHDILGPRIRWWYLARLQRTVLSELSLDESLDLYYDLFGYDKKTEPKLEQLDKTGFSPDYVFRETKRSVASAAGKTKIYPGIGFDVPWGSQTFVGDPEKVYEAVLRAFEAGADGIVVSREYEEMRLPNLKAVGRAMRQVNAKKA
jgi:hypothetical protein